MKKSAENLRGMLEYCVLMTSIIKENEELKNKFIEEFNKLSCSDPSGIMEEFSNVCDMIDSSAFSRYDEVQMLLKKRGIYGIDLSKYQHGKGRKKYAINWNRLRITHLGRLSKKTVSGTVNFPIRFIYIKSTEGKSLLNPYYRKDYRDAKAHGYKVGTYHFFTTITPAAEQARHFLKHSIIRKGDFPPVLDVEPLPSQIKKMGGSGVLFARIRTWLRIVERATGVKPILYISQTFVNRYLPQAPNLKHNYQVWIARYGEYKPDIRLVYWQLCPDGRVAGIHGEVDINVFNGYDDAFQSFVKNKTVK